MNVRRLWILACTIAVALTVAACGSSNNPQTNKQSTVGQLSGHEVGSEINDGEYVEGGPITYQLQISRELNPYSVQDAHLIRGLPKGYPPPTADQFWYGVFMWAKNQHHHPYKTSDNFEIVDTTGAVHRPIDLNPQRTRGRGPRKPCSTGRPSRVRTASSPTTRRRAGCCCSTPVHGLLQPAADAVHPEPAGQEALVDLARPLTRARRPARLIVAPLLIVLAVLLIGAGPALGAGWGKPFALQKPGTLDAIAPQLAFAPGGAAAAGFGTEQVDIPGTAQAQYVTRTAGGHVGPVRNLRGARQILAMSYDGPQLELLAGVSARNQDCCSAVEAVRVGAGGAAQRPRRLVTNLAGFTAGRLLTLAGGRMLAAVATERGIWVSQSARSNRFARDRRVSPNGQVPESMDAAWLGGADSIVAWTAGKGSITGAINPRQIYVATGSGSGGPKRSKVAVTVPAGHRIDQIAVARHGSGATLAWIESWYGRHGAYRSRVEVSDLGASASPRALSPAGRIASGLSLVSDASGDQGIVWESCTTNGACTVAGIGSAGWWLVLGAQDARRDRLLADPVAGDLAVGTAAGRGLAAWRGHSALASVGFRKATVLSRTTVRVRGRGRLRAAPSGARGVGSGHAQPERGRVRLPLCAGLGISG